MIARSIGVVDIALIAFLAYIAYQLFLHPLAKYPGSPLAALTNLWKAYRSYSRTLHDELLRLHGRLGPIIRIGPNNLHFWDAWAIAPLCKTGRSMGKTEFYDAFTAFNPNLFGTRNEAVSGFKKELLLLLILFIASLSAETLVSSRAFPSIILESRIYPGRSTEYPARRNPPLR
jgi:hypothetical protein